MLALYIIGGLILLIVILLNFPVSAFVSYENKNFFVRVKYLGFTLYPPKQKKSGESKEESKEESSEESSAKESAGDGEAFEAPEDSEDVLDESLLLPEYAEETEEPAMTHEEKKQQKELLKKQKALEKKRKKREKQKKNQDIKEKIALVKRLIASSGKGLRRILRGIRFRDLYLKLDVADEDAAQCAIKYGKVGAAVYDGLSFLRTFFTVSVEKIELNCRYYTSEGEVAAHGTVSLRPATLIGAIIGIGMKFLILTIKERKQARKEDNK